MTKKTKKVNNGLENAVNFGYSDMQAINMGEIASNASPYLLSLRPIILNNTYKSNSFAKLAIDLPVNDAFRNGGFEIDSQTLSADELLQLNDFINDKGDRNTLKDCARWGRLFGGGVILASTNQKEEAPLNIKTLKGKEVEFFACDRWQCFPQDSNLYTAEKFTVQNDFTLNEGNILTYHKSRLRVYTGETQPWYLRNQLNGWGVSVFEAITPSLSQYIKANNVILELLDEAKIDILKVAELNSTLASEGGEALIRKRFQIFAEEKNYRSLGVLDAQDDYDQKQMNFGSLDQMIEKIMLLICSALRLPYSKVFGKGASGFSSGEDDLENYNGMVMSTIREPLLPIIKWMLDIRCMQLFGRTIDDLVIKWKPLRVLNEVEEQNIKSQKINSYIQLLEAGVITRKQVAEQLTTENIILFKPEEIEQMSDEMSDEEIDVDRLQEETIVKNSRNKLFGLFK